MEDEKMATIKEIAAKSGYSPTTVSRLLSNDPSLSVSPQTKSKILKIANDLGYWNKKDREQIKYVIALLYQVNPVEHLQDEYFSDLKEKIEEESHSQNIELTEYSQIDDLINDADKYQGFIAVSTNYIEKSKLDKLHRVLPYGIFIDSNPAPKIFDSIKPNLALTVKDAIDRLLDKGIDSIGFIGNYVFNVANKRTHDIRELAFKEYCEEKNLKNSPIFVDNTASVKTGYQLANKAISECEKLPQAFIISSDTLSVGALQAFNEAGIKIPQQTAIISINNNEVAKYVSPPLSSYNIDLQLMSRLAINDLIDQMGSNRNYLNVHLMLNTDLVIRKSFY